MIEELETVYRRVSSIASDTPFGQRVGGKNNALATAVGVIGAYEGFEVDPKFKASDNETFDEAVRRMALLSGFRFRQVHLDGDWWKHEGPSLLVSFGPENTPLAVVHRQQSYFIQNPTTGELTPISQEIAGEISDVSFQLYPGFNHQLTPQTLIDFSLHDSKRELWTLLGAAGLATLIALIVPIATSVVVSTAIPDGRTYLLVEMAALVGAGAFGILAIGSLRSLLAIRWEARVNMRLQAAIWDRVLRLPSTFFRNYSSGDLVRRVLAIDECRQLVTGPVFAGFLSGFFSITSFILMLLYDPWLALFGVLFAAASISVLCAFAVLQVKHIKQYRLAQGEVTSHVLGLISGINKLRLAAAEERGLLQWSSSFSAQQRALWQYSRLRALQSTFTNVIGPLGICGAIVVAGFRSEPISLAAFTAFNAAFGQFLAAAGSFATALNALVSASPLIDRAKPLLSAEPEADRAAADPGTLSGGFAFRNVSFRYNDNGPLVLDDINFNVSPGEFVAIVGPSGAGKSTILRLLLGFERPVSGTVSYDDKDLAQLDFRRVRQQIGTVLQSVGLLPGSIYDNIAGARILTDEEVMEAAKRAALADDIASFPMGLDTFISEDAGTFSGGQRQRTMIARALVGNPSIMFLDEATSSLDNHTQSIVQKSIDELNVTRLVIAHRLSTIRNADRILVLKGGKIVESGNFDELMKNEGEFYSLAKRQLV